MTKIREKGWTTWNIDAEQTSAWWRSSQAEVMLKIFHSTDVNVQHLCSETERSTPSNKCFWFSGKSLSLRQVKDCVASYIFIFPVLLKWVKSTVAQLYA